MIMYSSFLCGGARAGWRGAARGEGAGLLYPLVWNLSDRHVHDLYPGWRVTSRRADSCRTHHPCYSCTPIERDDLFLGFSFVNYFFFPSFNCTTRSDGIYPHQDYGFGWFSVLFFLEFVARCRSAGEWEGGEVPRLFSLNLLRVLFVLEKAKKNKNER